MLFAQQCSVRNPRGCARWLVACCSLQASAAQPFSAPSLRIRAQPRAAVGSPSFASSATQRAHGTATAGSDAGESAGAAALAALKRGDWSIAWQLAAAAADSGGRDADVLYTRGVALTRLGAVWDAEGYLQMVLAQDPEHESAKAALTLLPELREEAAGWPSPAKMYFDPMRRPFATYIGPLEFFRTADQGRGLRLTADVKQGELLMMDSVQALSESTTQSVEEVTDAMLEAAHRHSRGSAIDAARLATMYDGTEDSLQRLPDIKQLWAPSTEDALRKLTAQPHEHLTLERLRRVDFLNGYGTAKDGDPLAEEMSLSEPDPIRRRGLWLLAALINHSCAPNANLVWIDDTAFTRAAQDLHAGEEVTVAYSSEIVQKPLAERQRALEKGWGFRCSCARCTMERQLPESFHTAAAAASSAAQPEPPGPLITGILSAVKEPDPLAALETAIHEGLGLVAAMQGELPAGLPSKQRDTALAPAFDVLIQLLPVLKALGNSQAAIQLGQRCVELAAAVHPGSAAHVGATITVWQDAGEAAAEDTSGAGDAMHIVAAGNMTDAVRMSYGRELTDEEAIKLAERDAA